jgi:hypothetical protein
MEELEWKRRMEEDLRRENDKRLGPEMFGPRVWDVNAGPAILKALRKRRPELSRVFRTVKSKEFAAGNSEADAEKAALLEVAKIGALVANEALLQELEPLFASAGIVVSHHSPA